MAIRNLNDWIIVLTADPILGGRACGRLRETVHRVKFNNVRMQKVFDLFKLVDFENSNQRVIRVFRNICITYLFDDDVPEPEPQNYVFDIIIKKKGNIFIRKIDEMTNLPTGLRDNLIIRISEIMNGNLSTNLQTEIDLLNN